MHTIGLISDTHGAIDSRILDFFKDADEVWHAGDFGSIEVSKKLRAFKKIRGVYGNCDGQDIRLYHPYIQLFTLEGVKFLITHIGGYPGRYHHNALNLIESHRPDVFICGHSHILKVINDPKYNMVTINPGAAGRQGFQTVMTALKFEVECGKLKNMEVAEWDL
jgi:putative phosphoesterase